MKHKRNPYIIPRRTLEELQADLQRRASGAAGTHADRRTRRVRTRAARRARALKDW